MSQDKGKNKAALGAVGVLGIVFLKFQGLLLAGLKALSLVKFSWLLSSVGTMLVSLLLYIQFYGWSFAIALIILLYIHEMGHYTWAKAVGLDPKLPKFFFFFAFVSTRLAREEATNAWVAFAGPLIGSVGSAAMYWSGLHLNNTWLMAAGSTGFWLNLMQLIPSKPFDGGHVISSVSRWLLIPGLVLMFTLAFALHSFFLVAIGIFSFITLIGDFRKSKGSKDGKQQVVKSPAGAILTLRDLERAAHAAPSVKPEAVQTPTSDQQDATAQTIDVSAQAPQPQTITGVVQEFLPATFMQRITIGFAYVTLVGILGYLYWLTAADMKELMPK